jgi:hypothetical protein
MIHESFNQQKTQDACGISSWLVSRGTDSCFGVRGDVRWIRPSNFRYNSGNVKNCPTCSSRSVVGLDGLLRNIYHGEGVRARRAVSGLNPGCEWDKIWNKSIVGPVWNLMPLDLLLQTSVKSVRVCTRAGYIFIGSEFTRLQDVALSKRVSTFLNIFFVIS